MRRHKSYRRHLLLATVALLALQIARAAPAGAISLNNNVAVDTPAAASVFDHANTHPNVVMVSGCTGTLINSRTVLTAAHCFYNNDTFAPGASIDIRFGADSNIPTPFDQTAGGLAVPPGYTFDGTASDIAIVTLSTPVTGASIAPVALLGPDDPRPGPGVRMVTVGYGQYGTGNDGGLYAVPEAEGGAPTDGRRRVGETRLGDYVLWNYDGRTPGPYGIYAAQFRDPHAPSAHDDYQLTAKGFDVPVGQAGNGAGDSGGPLFLVQPDGTLVQIGVLALLSPAPDGTIRYGSISGWTALQDYQTWLDVTNPLRVVAARQGNAVWSDPTAWSEGEVPDNRPGALAGPYGLAGRYFDVRLSEPGRLRLDMDATIDGLGVTGGQTTLDLSAPYTLQVVTGAAMGSGQITLSGTLATPFLTVEGGVLTGTGTVRSMDFGVRDLASGVINSAGTVAPGNPDRTGTMTIDGDYRQRRNGTLSVRLGDRGSDMLSVTGQADLAGRAAIFGLGPVTLDAAYPILIAGGVTGQFEDVRSDFAFVKANLAYAPAEVSAILSRNAVAFADVAQTLNQAAAAAAFDRLDSSHPLYRSVVGLNAATARHAFDIGSGEIHASARSVLIDDSRHLREAANRRLREPPTAPGPRDAFNSIGGAAPALSRDPQRFSLWGHAYGAAGHLDGDGNAGRVDRRSGGLLVGGDAVLDHSWRLGALAGYHQTSFSAASRRSTARSENYHIGLYGGGDLGAVFLRSGAFYSAHDIGTHREVAFTGFADQARATYRAHTFQAFVEIGTSWHHAAGSLEPYFNLAHVQLTTGSFAETAHAAALHAASQTSSVSFATTGLRASTSFLAASRRMAVSGGVGWRHAFGDRLPLATLGLAAADFKVAGVAIAQNTAVLDAAVHMQMAPDADVSLSYSGQLAPNAFEHAITAKLRIGL